MLQKQRGLRSMVRCSCKIGGSRSHCIIYTIMHEFHLVSNKLERTFAPHITIGRLLIAQQDDE